MARDLDPALVAELTASQLRPVFFAEFEFSSGTVRFWNGIGDFTALGHTFNGGGNLIGMQAYSEVSNLQAEGMSFKLSGIPSSLVSVALSEPYQGRTCRLYLGALNDSLQLVSDPVQIFSGLMDVMEISIGGDTCTIALKAESKMIMINRTKEYLYTTESQKADYPDDLGFEFVPQLQDKEILWKAKA